MVSLHAWRRVARLTPRKAEGRAVLTPRMAEGSAPHSTHGGGSCRGGDVFLQRSGPFTGWGAAVTHVSPPAGPRAS